MASLRALEFVESKVTPHPRPFSQGRGGHAGLALFINCMRSRLSTGLRYGGREALIPSLREAPLIGEKLNPNRYSDAKQKQESKKNAYREIVVTMPCQGQTRG